MVQNVYIYIYRSIHTGFEQWLCFSGLSKWYWSWFLLIYVHIYVAKFIYIVTWFCLQEVKFFSMARRLPAPSCAIFHVLGSPPVAPKNRHWCTLILRLLEIFQRCEAERERNLLMPFRYVVVLTKTDLSKWPGDSTRKEPATFVSVVARASSFNH